MSLPNPPTVDMTMAEPGAVLTPPVAPASGPRTVAIWAIGACLLLGLSAAYRMIQDRNQIAEVSVLQICPFPLDSQIPRELGRWKSKEDQKLDSQTLLITGGKEYIIRTYVDDLTGVRLIVLLLFGPAEPVIPHVPEVCYPANGFNSADVALNRIVPFEYTDASGKEVNGKTARFRSAVYKKTQSRLIEGVYHSFRYNGVWSPDVGLDSKLSTRNLGVFKLQIQRLVAEGESRDSEKYPEPIEDFLKVLLPEIERNISLASAKSSASTKAVASK